MIAAHGIELRAGSRLLLDGRHLPDRRRRPGRARRAQRGGQDHPDQGPGRPGRSRRRARSPAPAPRSGYLPQDPRTGDLHVLARDRILSARGLDPIIAATCAPTEGAMASADDEHP